RRVAAIGGRNLLAGRKITACEVVGLDVVGIEARPALRIPEEVAVEPDEHEKADANGAFDEPAAPRIPPAGGDEGPAYPRDHQADAPADRLKDAGEEIDDRIEHGSPSVVEPVKPRAETRLVFQIRIFQRLDNMAPPHLVETFVIAIEALLVEYVARDEVERNEIRDQPAREPGVGMVGFCSHDQ